MTRWTPSGPRARVLIALATAALAATLSVSVALAILPAYTLLAVLSLPLLVRALRASELGASGQQRAIAMIDLETAQLHATFGLLNSTPHSAFLPPAEMRGLLAGMAARALVCTPAG